MTRFVLIVLGVAIAVTGVAMLADVAGFPPSGAAIGGVIGGVVAAMMIAQSGGKSCPRCGTELPKVRRPASLKQALWGGWTCPHCGAEVDRKGNPVGSSAGA
jgi:hypothetical protein